MRRIPMFAVVAVIASSGLCNSTFAAGGITVQNGFLTGLDYRHESDSFRCGYSMGLLDGLFASVFLGASESAMLGIKNCFPRMSGVQLRAMLDKHIEDHPERWHDYAGILFYQVLLDTCPSIRHPPNRQP